MFLNQLSDENKKLFLSLETILTHVDGDFSISEQRLISNHCAEMGIEPIEFNEKLHLEDLAVNINNSMSVRDKKIIFIELIAVALVDGEYHENEKKFIDSLRSFLGIPQEVSEQAIELIQKLLAVSNEVENFVEW